MKQPKVITEGGRRFAVGPKGKKYEVVTTDLNLDDGENAKFSAHMAKESAREAKLKKKK